MEEDSKWPMALQFPLGGGGGLGEAGLAPVPRLSNSHAVEGAGRW